MWNAARRRPRLAARRQFGNVAVVKEQVRDMWTFPSFESFWRDIRYALRTLRRSPAFTIVALTVLAIGIGANTAMFSLVDAMFLRGLPYADADRLVVLIGNVQRTVVERRGNSYPDHLDWRAKSTSFVDMAAYTSTTTTLFGTDEPERVPVEFVSAPYFSIVSVAPAHGRTFRADEDAVPNRDFVVVLGDGLWKRRFGGDPAIVNKTIQLGTRTFTVIGIMPPGFRGVTDTADAWLPFALSGLLDNRGNRNFQTVARLKPDVSLDAARADLAVISRQLESAYPATNDKRGVEISPLSVETFGQLRPVVTTFMIAVVLVLLIACANVANLLIGRSDVRQKEIAVRTALGAGKARLMRQLVTESLVLTGLGAAAGVALAQLTMGAIIRNSPVPFPTFLQPRLNLTVVLFTVAIAVVTGVVVGLAPALHARFSRLTDALKESARGSGGVRSQRLRSSLVVVEVALAIMLLVGAGMMIRSVQNLTAVDPGFDPSGVLTLSAAIPRQPAPPPGPAAPGTPPPAPPPFVLSGRDLLERVRAVPGVAIAALASDIPLGASSSATFYSAEGDTTADAQTRPRAYVHRVSPQFFEALGVPFTGRTSVHRKRCDAGQHRGDRQRGRRPPVLARTGRHRPAAQARAARVAESLAHDCRRRRRLEVPRSAAEPDARSRFVLPGARSHAAEPDRARRCRSRLALGVDPIGDPFRTPGHRRLQRESPGHAGAGADGGATLHELDAGAVRDDGAGAVDRRHLRGDVVPRHAATPRVRHPPGPRRQPR